MSIEQTINNLREKIDNIDTEIIKLLINRKELSSCLIHTKIENNLPVLDKARESKIINNCCTFANNNINQVLIKKIFSLIFEDSKRQYYKLEKLDSISSYIQNRKTLIIDGPCVVEQEDQINNLAEELSSYGVKFLRGGAFKPRTSPHTFQGLGDVGVRQLSEVAKKKNVSVTEV